MKWKLKTETKYNLLAVVVIQMLLVFVPRHPSALPASKFRHCLPQLYSVMCSLGLLFMFSAAVYLWCSILSNQLIALYMRLMFESEHYTNISAFGKYWGGGRGGNLFGMDLSYSGKKP